MMPKSDKAVFQKQLSFKITRSQLEGRFESEYYRPEIKLLEDIIRTKSVRTLKSYIVSIASGATPDVTQEDKYYTDKEDGIPFLRVQNLQTNGRLNLKDCRRINRFTHETMLKRSQVSSGDLLVKITGVGRMAIASVAPEGFVGNTNQHMVVIKTANRSESEYLANYLNLDIIEKLASRRSTGATRPALDYNALKSIPIIEGLNFDLLEEAERKRNLLDSEIVKLEQSITPYLLEKLAIDIPILSEGLSSRIFVVKYSEVNSGRLDPSGARLHKHRIEGGKFENLLLKNVASLTKGQSISKEDTTEGPYKVIAGGQSSPYTHHIFNQERNCITVSASGAYAGFVWYHDEPIFASDCTVIRSKNEDELSTLFLYEILKLKQTEIYTLQQGSGQPHVYPSDLGQLKIPIPDMKDEQRQILSHIQKIREKTNELETQKGLLMPAAQKTMENIILN